MRQPFADCQLGLFTQERVPQGKHVDLPHLFGKVFGSELRIDAFFQRVAGITDDVCQLDGLRANRCLAALGNLRGHILFVGE